MLPYCVASYPLRYMSRRIHWTHLLRSLSIRLVVCDPVFKISPRVIAPASWLDLLIGGLSGTIVIPFSTQAFLLAFPQISSGPYFQDSNSGDVGDSQLKAPGSQLSPYSFNSLFPPLPPPPRIDEGYLPL